MTLLELLLFLGFCFYVYHRVGKKLARKFTSWFEKEFLNDGE